MDTRTQQTRTGISRAAAPRKTTLICTLACLLALPLTAPGMDLDKQVAFHIPAQDLSSALIEFSKQTRLQVIVSDDLTGQTTEGVSGQKAIKQALSQLLEPAGLHYRVAGETSITVGRTLKAAAAETHTTRAGRGNSFLRIAQASRTDTTSSSATQDEQSSADRAGTEKTSPPKGGDREGAVDEVVVTAQKRTEREQDVPLSLTVLSGDKLIAQGVVQLADYAKQVPGLNLIGGSGPGQGQVVLRGVTTGSDHTASVSLYLDEIPLTPSSPLSGTQTTLASLNHSFDPDLADIERIEVLAGPQSTLYGASAEGGLIKFVTRRPDFNNFEGSVRSDGSQIDGGSTGYGVRGSVNIPIAKDRAGMRASVFYRRDAGFVDNLFYRDRDVNESVVKGGRLSLRVKLADALETTLSGLVQDIDSDGTNQIYLTGNGGSLKPALGSLAYSSPVHQPTTGRYRSLSDTTTLDLGFATLTNIASYAHMVSNTFIDFSALSGLVGGSPVSYQGNPHSTRYSDELRLASAPRRLEWLLGAFYTHEKNLWNVNLRGTDAAGVIVPPTSPYYDVYTYAVSPVFEEKAAFGDLTYHLTDQLEGTVGIRYSANNQTFRAVSTGILGVEDIRGSSTDSATNYLATVSYKPVSTLTLYVRAASAYRPGGPNDLTPLQIAAGVPSSFHSDQLWNYEGGIKGSLWNHRINYSADVYHMDWTDVQITVVIQNFASIGNAAKAKSDGAEVSLQFIPVDDLTVSLKAAYANARLTSNAPSIGAVSGDPLPFSPKTSAAAIVDYRIPVSKRFAANLGLTYAYHGSQNTGFSDAGSFTLPSYDTLDLRGGLDWSRYSLIARIDNATDNFGVTSARPALAVGSPLTGAVIRPRTFGLSLEVRF